MDDPRLSALANLAPVAAIPADVERTRVIRRGATITSHIYHDHAHRVDAARRAVGLPRWPVTTLTLSAQ